MAINGQSAIWRDGTETSSSDKVEFNETAVINTNGSLMNTSFIMTTGIARNERPGAIDKLQDTGPNGITITLSGTVSDPEGDNTVAHRLKKWLLQPKTVDGTYPKGRFGLRLNDFDVFDLTPTAYLGYMVESIEFRRDGETKGKLSFVMILRFNGDITNNGVEPNGSGEYEW